MAQTLAIDRSGGDAGGDGGGGGSAPFVATAAPAPAVCAPGLAFGSNSVGRDPEDVPWSSSSAMPNPRAIVRVATPAPRPQCAEARRSDLSSC